MVREATNRLLELIEEGLLDKDTVILARKDTHHAPLRPRI
jgi:hypothetical protein